MGPCDLKYVLDAKLYRWRNGEMLSEEFGDQTTCCPLEYKPAEQ